MSDKTIWHKVLGNKDELKEGRVMSVTAGHKDICLSHWKGKLTALNNKCPHQGGPLGEGSIENGQIRYPWHGWDFCPHGGSSGDFDDGLETFPIKVEGN
jgi:pyruvate oxidase